MTIAFWFRVAHPRGLIAELSFDSHTRLDCLGLFLFSDGCADVADTAAPSVTTSNPSRVEDPANTFRRPPNDYRSACQQSRPFRSFQGWVIRCVPIPRATMWRPENASQRCLSGQLAGASSPGSHSACLRCGVPDDDEDFCCCRAASANGAEYTDPVGIKGPMPLSTPRSGSRLKGTPCIITYPTLATAAAGHPANRLR